MADLNQGEATGFFRSLGFHSHKVIDLHFADRQGKVTNNHFAKKVYPAEAGHFDMLIVGPECAGGVVEVKKGDETAFPFAKVRDDQRAWYHRVAVPKRLSAWIFFDIGERARSDWATVWDEILTERRSRKVDKKRDLPRLTVLMPFGKYLECENNHLPDRKSLPYEYVANELAPYILGWSGGLVLPDVHAFRSEFSRIFIRSIEEHSEEAANHGSDQGNHSQRLAG